MSRRRYAAAPVVRRVFAERDRIAAAADAMRGERVGEPARALRAHAQVGLVGADLIVRTDTGENDPGARRGRQRLCAPDRSHHVVDDRLARGGQHRIVGERHLQALQALRERRQFRACGGHRVAVGQHPSSRRRARRQPRRRVRALAQSRPRALCLPVPARRRARGCRPWPATPADAARDAKRPHRRSTDNRCRRARFWHCRDRRDRARRAGESASGSISPCTLTVRQGSVSMPVNTKPGCACRRARQRPPCDRPNARAVRTAPSARPVPAAR